MRYPGWVPADQVAPRFTVDPSYDPVAGLWTYRYTVANSAGARQGIYKILIGVPGLLAPPGPLTVTVPAGWTGVTYPFENDLGLPGATFRSTFPDDSVGPASGAPPALIQPGTSLTGFVITSPYPPGYAQSYVQGYVVVPPLPDTAENDYVPSDTSNAQRGPVVFPNLALLTTDDQSTAAAGSAPETAGFLGAATAGRAGAALPNPVPVGVRFGRHGEQVDRSTFRALLNGVDVTPAFVRTRRTPRGQGPDAVAVFALGSSPLQAGANRLVLTVRGTAPGTSLAGVSSRVLTFGVRQ
ncbi:MAG: hypothetical protein ACJ79S_22420 [Gemmatimonadaceae bacterium]